MHRERIATCQLTCLQATMFHSYVSGVENAPPQSCIPVENAPPPSCIPEENAPPPSCTRTQCWSRRMCYKKSGRHYSCMVRVTREGQCEMLAGIKNRMRNALNMHRERIATCQLTCLQATMFHSYVTGVENAPPQSRIPVENAPPPSCTPEGNAPPPSCIPGENPPPLSCIPVENAPPPSRIPAENAPPPSCIRTQCWSRDMRYKKSGRHYSCMGRVSIER